MKTISAQKRYILSEEQAAFAAKRDNFVMLTNNVTYVVPAQPTFESEGFESVFAFPVLPTGNIGAPVPVGVAMLSPWSYGANATPAQDEKQVLTHCSQVGMPVLRLDSDNTQSLAEDFVFTFKGWMSVYVKSGDGIASKKRMKLDKPASRMAAAIAVAGTAAKAALPGVVEE